MNRVLLVEDEPAVASYITMCLQQEGFQITWLPNLAEAGSALNERFEIVLLDLMLPDGTADEFLAQHREALRGTPVVMVTGVAPDDERLVRCMQSGAVGFVRKTERTEELLRLLRAVLK